MLNRNSGIALVAVIFILINLSSCTEQRTAPLKLGTTVWVGYEPLYLAREKKYINDQEIKLVELLSATQVMNAYRNKTIDMAALTMDEVLILAEEGFDPVVFLVLDSSNGGDAIIANKQYKSFDELKSKKIGYENTAVGAYLLSRALDINSMTSGDVGLVAMNVNETESALVNKQVDAVVTFEPAKSRLLENGFVKVFSSKEVPNEIIDVLIIRKDLISKNKGHLNNLVDAWFKSLAYYKDNEIDSLRIMNQRLKLSEQRIVKAFEGVVFPQRAENLRFFENDESVPAITSIAVRVSSQMKKNKLLKNDISVFDMYDSSFLRN
ncbi:MAG: ABC transporter substrate-binding protein [Gammaproteobacteria bacterium]|nr:ABC transporter substrate-binding protein [Gammaproteobacteria bacterium]